MKLIKCNDCLELSINDISIKKCIWCNSKNIKIVNEKDLRFKEKMTWAMGFSKNFPCMRDNYTKIEN